MPGIRSATLDISEKEKDPSPNLSPKRREALKPPFPGREGGRGVRSAYNYVVSKSFLEMSINYFYSQSSTTRRK
jgi:hypothetical protein